MIMVQSVQSVCYLNKVFNSNSYSTFDLTITKQAKCSQNHPSILFYFICHTIITKNIGKEEEEKKKKWRGELTETIGTYEGLGLLEL